MIWKSKWRPSVPAKIGRTRRSRKLSIGEPARRRSGRSGRRTARSRAAGAGSRRSPTAGRSPRRPAVSFGGVGRLRRLGRRLRPAREPSRRSRPRSASARRARGRSRLASSFDRLPGCAVSEPPGVRSVRGSSRVRLRLSGERRPAASRRTLSRRSIWTMRPSWTTISTAPKRRPRRARSTVGRVVRSISLRELLDI